MKQISITNLIPKSLVVTQGKWCLPTTRNQYNPVAIKSKIKLDEKAFYNLGLWSGDKYVFGGSVGLTNTSKILIEEIQEFLGSLIEDKRRIKNIPINDNTAQRVYVNSWLLLKVLTKLDQNIQDYIQNENQMLSYLSGKIDADGTIMPQNFYSRTGLIKITYGNEKETLNNQILFKKFGYNSCIIPYKDRNAFDLKFTFLSSLKLISKLKLKQIEKQSKLTILRGLTRR